VPCVFFDFYFPIDKKNAVHGGSSVGGLIVRPRLDLNVVLPFQSRAAVESMSRERWIKTKSRYYSYSAKPDGVEQKTRKKNALPGDFLFFGRQTGCDGSEL